jgi:glycosyltransferase involved in cell wall biosynthesis
MKIAVVVHGRFHAFDLTRALLEQGHDVLLLTNYPKAIVKKFGVPPEKTSSYLAHGILSRSLVKAFGERFCEPQLHQMFGRWAARQLRGRSVDAIHSFSGISEEILQTIKGTGPIISIMRGSSHIEVQARLLAQEEKRAGVWIATPSRWMLEREKREYAAAPLIIVLSSFARQSFLDQGVPLEKLRIVPLGSELKRFRPSAQVIEDRCNRIRSGKPLRVLTVGSFSFQKGILDLVSVSKAMSGRMSFTFVGSISDEARSLKRNSSSYLTFIPKVRQHELPDYYRESDVFLFPTIQDGYAAVLAQAQASGLPILATTNCGAPDIVQESKTGWVRPIRRPEVLIERLCWCNENRAELADMVRDAYQQFQPRDWNHVAADLVKIYSEWNVPR